MMASRRALSLAAALASRRACGSISGSIGSIGWRGLHSSCSGGVAATGSDVDDNVEDPVDAAEMAEVLGDAPKEEDVQLARGDAIFEVPKIKHLTEIREDEVHKGWGGMMDTLEHEYWCDREREVMGSYPLDGQLHGQTLADAVKTEGQEAGTGYHSDSADDDYWDPFENQYLTEDELTFDKDYVAAPYLPDRIKQMMYFLYCNKGWTIQRLSQRFGIRTERVSVIINMKRTEPEMIASGRRETQVDDLLTEMYADLKMEGWSDDEWALDDELDDDKLAKRAEMRKAKDAARLQGPTGVVKLLMQRGEPVDAHYDHNVDLGVNVAILKDEQDPDDVFPRWDGELAAPTLNIRPPAKQLLPRAQRGASKSKYAFLDIGEGTLSARARHLRERSRVGGSKRRRTRGQAKVMRMVDNDFAVSTGTKEDMAYRTWHMHKYRVKPTVEQDGLDFNAWMAATGRDAAATEETVEA